MFQLEPLQPAHCALREIHCCCGPESTLPSIFESEIQPPLAQPPFWCRARLPLTCTLRKGLACDTAHWMVPPDAPVARFSTPRQKLQVALLPERKASERMLASETWSGDCPRPR